MNVYVAGSSQGDLTHIHDTIAFVRSQGLDIIDDWTYDVEIWGELPEAQLQERAIRSVRYVMASDIVFVVLSDDNDIPHSRGADFVIGMAMGFGIPVIVIENGCESFDHFYTKNHPGVTSIPSLMQWDDIPSILLNESRNPVGPYDGTWTVLQQMSLLLQYQVKSVSVIAQLRKVTPMILERVPSLQRDHVRKVLRSLFGLIA